MKFREVGVHLIGGCCGTTPAHITALRKGLANRQPIQEKKVVPLGIIVEATSMVLEKPSLVETVKKRHSVIVELDSPKHLNTEKYF